MATTQKKQTGASGAQKNTAGKTVAKRQKPRVPVKFDSGGFKLLGGVGLALAAVGALIVWAAQTAPEGVKTSSSTNYSVSRKLAEALPESATQWIATILGVLFFLFGVFCLVMAVVTVIKYFVAKAKE
ncbi:MAG: hypothetical protein RBS73_07000 [Prolixibacteraceae bacterium]|jgi:hypothetical protein|nr:hypothetical protein [Prolixibacteraceae bacterium]